MELNVAYSSDDTYTKHLMVSMISLLENNQDFDTINLYILSNGIENSNRQLLRETAEKYQANIEFFEFAAIEAKLKTDREFPVSAFGRLFLDDFIPKDKVLYLDCDSVINGSYYELMELDISDRLVCAVQDTVSSYYKQVIGMKKSDIYFNSGVILFNLKKWRDEEMQKKACEMILKFHGSVPHHDQGVLNAICYGRILRLHPKYNYQCPMFEYKPKELQKMNPNYYSVQELQEARDHPVFIHFTEGFSNRPWRDTCTHPNKDLYLRYLAMTPYAGQIDHASINRHSAIMQKAYQSLPFPLYRLFTYFVLQIKRIRDR
jgi:lipopolysaccharide biosynthesis glycosyltransferase